MNTNMNRNSIAQKKSDKESKAHQPLQSKESQPLLTFADNRPEAIALRQLQKIARVNSAALRSSEAPAKAYPNGVSPKENEGTNIHQDIETHATHTPIASSVIHQPVIQPMKAKHEVFNDQLRWAVTKAVALVTGNAVDNKNDRRVYEDLLGAIQSDFGVTTTVLEEIYSKCSSQTNFFFSIEGQAVLQKIDLKKLIDKPLDVYTRSVDLSPDWREYKNKLSGLKKGQKSPVKDDGFGFDPLNQQLKTTVEWHGLDDGSQEGIGMTASVLAADHKLGTPTSANTQQRAQELTEATQKPYVAGHILNMNLGGPGDNDLNIVAIPGDVNTEQSAKVEEKVKSSVHKDKKILFYKVTIGHEDDTKGVGINGEKFRYASKITSEWGEFEQGANLTGPPESKRINKHVIPIKSPSSIANHQKAFAYTSDDPEKGKAAEATQNPAKINIPENAIIFKDTTQVKIEYLSYAIYALKIEKLNNQVSELQSMMIEKESQMEQLKIKVTTIIKDKDLQIERLQTELDSAYNELEERAAALEQAHRKQTELTTSTAEREKLYSSEQAIQNELREDLKRAQQALDEQKNNKNIIIKKVIEYTLKQSKEPTSEDPDKNITELFGGMLSPNTRANAVAHWNRFKNEGIKGRKLDFDEDKSKRKAIENKILEIDNSGDLKDYKEKVRKCIAAIVNHDFSISDVHRIIYGMFSHLELRGFTSKPLMMPFPKEFLDYLDSPH